MRSRRWDESCEFFDEFPRRKQQVRGAVGPFRFQLQYVVAVFSDVQTLIGSWASWNVFNELTEAVTLERIDGGIRMQ